MQSIYSQYEGIRVHAVVQGEGKPVLLLHGWGGRADSFLPVAKGLEAERRVYRLDFPGFGESEVPHETWDVTDYARFLAQWIREQELAGVDIVAHSFGGRVSIILAATCPELVGKLVLVDSAGIIPKRSFKYRVKVGLAKIAKAILNLPVLGTFFKKTGIEAALRRRTGSADYRDLNENMDTYAGKTVKFKGLVAVEGKMPPDSFVIGRHIMTCCQDDIAYGGLICDWKGAKTLKQRDWVVLTARLTVEFHKAYRKKGPVLKAIKVEASSAPEQQVATFF